MSRTIRRKNASHEHASYVGRLEDVTKWDLERFSLDDPKQYLARMNARFHRDHPSGRWGVPRWFVRHRNKRVSRAVAAEIHRCTRADCWDDFIPAPDVSDAAWLWW